MLKCIKIWNIIKEDFNRRKGKKANIMIQILTYTGGKDKYQGKGIKVNSLHDVESLDAFDINIISLLDEKIWRNTGGSTETINNIDDLKSLSKILENSQKSNNIILLPQNEIFYYSYGYNARGGKSYLHQCELKDMLSNLSQYILRKLYPYIESLDLTYENTKTLLGDQEVPAAFYFNNAPQESITKSLKSEKATTIKAGKVILSTLFLDDYEKIILFLKNIGILGKKQERPSWMERINMFDDDEQLRIIQENQYLIAEYEKNIKNAKAVLDKNDKYKSVLYTNGDELVNVIFEILKEMLGCDLSEFKDKRKEDFNFKINDKVFIGEIKGINTNVKKANVSQVDVHVQEYLDDHEEAQGKIVSLLIINHQRNKPLEEREAIPDDQIRIAERNRSLIVETYTLLKLFEKYLSHEMSREECIDILQENIGLLTI